MRKFRETAFGSLKTTTSTSGVQRSWVGVSIVGEENIQFIRDLAGEECQTETSIVTRLLNIHLRNLRSNRSSNV